MDDPDWLLATLNDLRYATLYDPRIAGLDPRLRAAVLHAATRYAASANLTLDPDHDLASANFLQTSGAHGNQRSIADAALAAFVRTNPLLLSLPEIRNKFQAARDKSPEYLAGTRHAPRAMRARRGSQPIKERLGDLISGTLEAPNNAKAARLLHGTLHALSVDDCYYYCELDTEISVTHGTSPWYMFHSWAWGRRCYAAWLEANAYRVCPISGLSIGSLRADNPDHGHGQAWLLLAREYARPPVSCQRGHDHPARAVVRHQRSP